MAAERREGGGDVKKSRDGAEVKSKGSVQCRLGVLPRGVQRFVTGSKIEGEADAGHARTARPVSVQPARCVGVAEGLPAISAGHGQPARSACSPGILQRLSIG